MVDDKIKKVLARYDEIIKLILEQKVDEYSDKLDEIPPDEDEITYETYIQKVAMAEAEEQTRNMENEPDELLGGESMNEFFSYMSVDELTEVLEYAAVNLDRGVPSSVVTALAGKRDEDLERVAEYCATTIKESAWTQDELSDENTLFEMEFQKVRACFEVLAQMGDGSSVPYVIERFMSYDQTQEFVADSIATYLERFPGITVPLIIDTLKEHEEDGLTGPCEDLVIILTAIGKDNASEEIYSALRTAFRWMKNKIYAVICLADYGDARAVPMLKSYINRHQDTIERDLFYEMMSAIQNLGGDIEDISDPFGDFQKKKKD
ncbi:MAG: hypothetical protein J5685_05700 [Clostridiales bacterium]|nr:hypothetical protein [Clostridiales bacterium]